MPKKRFALWLCAALAVVVLSFMLVENASAYVLIDEENFPDWNFRQFIYQKISKYGYTLTDHMINNTKQLLISDYGFTDLTGIEYFTALEELRCNNNNLAALDVSKNTSLRILNCNNNEISTLDVSGCTALEWLDCSHNSLSELDVSNNEKLIFLKCYTNQLSELDISNNTLLYDINCAMNHISTLDVSENIALTGIDCYGNCLTTLDVSNNIALISLYCHNNNISELDLSNNPSLLQLSCYSCGLSELDIASNPEIDVLFCNDNQLTELDVSKNSAIYLLSCGNNNLSALDISMNSSLVFLSCSGNNLTELDVSNNTSLESLECQDNYLTTLDLLRNTALERINCSNNYLTALDLSQNERLIYFKCAENCIADTTALVAHNTILAENMENDEDPWYDVYPGQVLPQREGGVDFTQGEEGVWARGDGSGLEFIINIDYSAESFRGVAVDNNMISEDDYTVRQGSTVITLMESFLNTLPAGSHTLTAFFEDGFAEAVFHISVAPPPTGDRGMPALWIGALVILCGAVCLYASMTHRKAYTKQEPS